MPVIVQATSDAAIDRTVGAAYDGTSSRRIMAILALLMAFASISTDFYLPALPTMVRALHASAGSMEFTISGFLVGFSLGQLVWGPIGDRFGRRLPVIIGVVFFVIGSAGCALATGAASIIACRLVQAFGASACVVLARAMVRDLHAGDKAARMLSTLMTVMAIAPLIGPILGGQILAFAGWRVIFWTLVGVGLLTLAALSTLAETLPASRRSTTPLGSAFADYGLLLRDRRLLAYAGTCGFFFAGTFAYIAGSAFAYIDYHHVPASAYGLLIGTGIVGMMVTNFINGRVVGRVGVDRMLLVGASVAGLAGIVVAIDAALDLGGVAGLAVPLFLFVSVTGLVVANSVAGALSAYKGQSGAVSALLGAIQYGSGMVGSAAAGALADGTPRAMALMVAVGGVGCLCCALLLHCSRAAATASLA